MPRAHSDSSRDAVIPVRVSKATLAAVDASRGEVSRSAWVERQILAGIGQHPAAPEPVQIIPLEPLAAGKPRRKTASKPPAETAPPAPDPEPRPRPSVIQRCQKDGVRRIGGWFGGWCSDCQIRVLADGRLPEGAACTRK